MNKRRVLVLRALAERQNRKITFSQGQSQLQSKTKLKVG